MTTTGELLQQIRDQRSSESNFDQLYQILQTARQQAVQNRQAGLDEALKEVDEKYAAEYKTLKETRGTAWPEFEKFVSEMERALTSAAKNEA